MYRGVKCSWGRRSREKRRACSVQLEEVEMSAGVKLALHRPPPLAPLILNPPLFCLPPPLSSTEEGTMYKLEGLHQSMRHRSLCGSICHVQVMHSFTPAPYMFSVMHIHKHTSAPHPPPCPSYGVVITQLNCIW